MAVPNPAVGQFLRLTALAYVNSQIGQNACDFQIGAQLGTGSTLNALLNAWSTTVVSNWLPPMPSNVILTGTIAQLFDTITGKVTQSVVKEDGTNHGAGSADVAPTQVAFVVKKKTGLAGKKFNGRFFYPFLDAAQLTADGQIAGAYQTTIVAALSLTFGSQSLITAGNGYSVIPQILHRPAPLTGTIVSVIVSSGQLGTQRRRGDYGRRNLPL